MLENNILMIVNEASGKDTYSINENIKAHVTNISINIEHKGLKPCKIYNCSHVTFLTNNENSVKIDVEDRRFAAIECCDKYANNKEYFSKLLAETKSKKYNMCFY